MQAKPFYLTKRESRSKKDRKPIFYVRFRQADGQIATAMSTGETSEGAA